MHHTSFTVLWEKLHRFFTSPITWKLGVKWDKEALPAETMHIVIGQTNQKWVLQWNQIKILPHPKGCSLLFTLGSLETHLGNLVDPLSGGVRASGSFTFRNFVDSLRTNQPVAGMTKLSLLKELIRNLLIIQALGHFTQHQQNQCK